MAKIHWNLKTSSQGQMGQFQLNFAQSILEVDSIFPRGDNNEMAKIHWRSLEIFYPRTNEPYLIKISTKHSRVKGIQIWSNEGPHPFSRKYDNEIAKIHWWDLKVFFPRTNEPILTKLSSKHN